MNRFGAGNKQYITKDNTPVKYMKKWKLITLVTFISYVRVEYNS